MGFYNDWAYYLRYGFKPHDDAIDSLRYVFMTKSQKEQKGMGIEMSGGMPKTAAEQTAELVGALEKDLSKERDLRERLELQVKLLRGELNKCQASGEIAKEEKEVLKKNLGDEKMKLERAKKLIREKSEELFKDDVKINSLSAEVIRLEGKLRDSQANYELVRKQLNRQADEEINRHPAAEDCFFMQYGKMFVKGYFSPNMTGEISIEQLYEAFEREFRRRNNPIDANGNPGNWEATK